MKKTRKKKTANLPGPEAPKKSLHDLREAVSKFKNATPEPPKTCSSCGLRPRRDRIRIVNRFPCEIHYLYCDTCRDILYRFAPVILMPPQTDRGFLSPPPVRPTA